MPRITRSALVMFSAEQMFRLVNDVDAYPEFLPGCVGSRVHESGEDYMMASVDVAKAGIAKTFTTRNQLDANRTIKMELVEGPLGELFKRSTYCDLHETNSFGTSLSAFTEHRSSRLETREHVD